MSAIARNQGPQARRAAPVRPLGRALLRRWSVERALEVGGAIKRADPALQRPPGGRALALWGVS